MVAVSPDTGAARAAKPTSFGFANVLVACISSWVSTADAVVDDAAEVLDEMAVDMRVDRRPRLRRIDFDFGIGRWERPKACERGNASRGGGLEEGTSVSSHDCFPTMAWKNGSLMLRETFSYSNTI